MDKLDLLASLANVSLSPSTAEKAAPLAAGQWRALFADAGRHHLLPLMWKNLRKWGLAERLPPEIRQSAERRAMESAIYTSYLIDVGRRLLQSARERGLLLVPLKGMHLVPEYYSADERPMIDVDFLVREDDAGAVRSMMLELGFELQPDRLTPEFLRRFGGEYKFAGGVGEVPAVVETQWNIAAAPHLGRGYAFDPRWLVGRVGEDGRLGAEATLVYLVFHLGVAHSFSRLVWLLDVHRVIAKGGLRWDELGEVVERFGMRRLFLCAIRLCGDFFGTQAPGDFVSRLGGEEGGRWAVGAARGCLMGRGWMLRTGALPLMLGRRRAAAAAAFLFPGVEFVSLRYGMPRWKAAFYQFVRPAVVVAEAMRRKGTRD